MSAKVISINVGRPREVEWRGARIRTGIFKSAVTGRVRVGPLNLEGDEQADLAVHGGPYKSVYVYPSEHYPFWSQARPDMELPWGVFGENLTTQGLDENDVEIGDRLRIGTARFQVTQPRLPCQKLALRFDSLDMPKHFLESGRSGFYLTVLDQGEIEAGDAITLERGGSGLSVARLVNLYTGRDADRHALVEASRLASLAPSWREKLAKRLEALP